MAKAERVEGNALPHLRLESIQERLRKGGHVRIDELAAEFAVSEMTIRRDLDELQLQGVARRIRGGAMAVGPEKFEARHAHQAKAKTRIAEKLLALVPHSGAIALDASSTVHRLASAIEGARDLIVVTNGLDTFDALRGKPGIRAVLSGGWAEPRTGSLVGPSANRIASDFVFELFIFSAAAFDPRMGASEASVEEAEWKRAIAGVAKRRILALDHSKLGRHASVRSFEPRSLSLLVTDLEPRDRRLADIQIPLG
jgi:DeoR family fructose operon transcriptional repressor